VSSLVKAGVSEQNLIKITGHSSASSIKPYLQLQTDHHLNLVSSLREHSENIDAPIQRSSNNLFQLHQQSSATVTKESTSIVESSLQGEIARKNGVFNNNSFLI